MSVILLLINQLRTNLNLYEHLQNLYMVPRAGVEPAWSFLRGILSPLRLPISPPGQDLEAGAGIEPARMFYIRGILNPLRLPVSPPGQFCVGG